jgi:hypothetical protein
MLPLAGDAAMALAGSRYTALEPVANRVARPTDAARGDHQGAGQPYETARS